MRMRKARVHSIEDGFHLIENTSIHGRIDCCCIFSRFAKENRTGCIDGWFVLLENRGIACQDSLNSVFSAEQRHLLLELTEIGLLQ